MNELIRQIVENPLPSLAVIGNLIIIESLLSVDNAAVLATMVMDLPKEQRKKALKYGIIGAYVFRGICLLFATFLIEIWWLKPLGGIYLVYLAYSFFNRKPNLKKEKIPAVTTDKKNHWLYKKSIGYMGPFWTTVALVELVDLAFSIDNVFAAVAFSKNIILIWVGVFIGILAMRFVAQRFVKLMETYPFLETIAFIVIAILGIKLSLSLYEHYFPEQVFSKFLSSHTADWGISIITVALFLIPVLTSSLFNYPRKKNK